MLHRETRCRCVTETRMESPPNHNSALEPSPRRVIALKRTCRPDLRRDAILDVPASAARIKRWPPSRELDGVRGSAPYNKLFNLWVRECGVGDKTCTKGGADGLPHCHAAQTKKASDKLSNRDSAKPSGPLETAPNDFLPVARVDLKLEKRNSGVAFRIQTMQNFLKSEVDKVQRQSTVALGRASIS